MITKNCVHCGAEFEAQRSNAKYCRQSCRTMASNAKNGFKIGRIRIKEKDKCLAVEDPPQLAPQGLNGINTGRANDELTLAGILEGLFGAGAANLISHQLTKGEYDERLAKIQKTANQILYELQKQNNGNKPLQQANKGKTIHAQDLQKPGMPLINFPTDPMM